MNVGLIPLDGDPGPVVCDFTGLRVITLDMHRWFEPEQSEPERGERSNGESFFSELCTLVENAGNRAIMILSHYPPNTYGPHGGFFDWKDHLFPLTHAADYLYVPLPIVGSLYPLGRRYLVRNRLDTYSPEYREMLESISDALRGSGPHSSGPGAGVNGADTLDEAATGSNAYNSAVDRLIIFAAGHEHSLQVLEEGASAEYVLVSGSGSESKLTPVGHGKGTLFAHHHTGFMAVDFFLDGRILLRVVEPAVEEVVFRLRPDK